MRFTTLPTGVKLRTPSGRLAIVQYCEDQRVHVRYLDGDPDQKRDELGCYPIRLVKDWDIIDGRST